MPKEKKDKKIVSALSKLEEIVEWFENQSEIDVEEGLVKMREGAGIIKDLKAKLKKAENEFEEIKKDLMEND